MPSISFGGQTYDIKVKGEAKSNYLEPGKLNDLKTNKKDDLVIDTGNGSLLRFSADNLEIVGLKGTIKPGTEVYFFDDTDLGSEIDDSGLESEGEITNGKFVMFNNENKDVK